MSHYVRIASGFLLAALAALAACNKPAPGAGPAASANPAGTPPPVAASASAAPSVDPEEERDAVLSEKLSHYIQCINDTDSYVHASHDMLLNSLTPKQEVMRNRSPNFRATTVVRDRCYKGLDEAVKLPPKLDDLEQAAAAFRAAIEKLEPTLADADRYYNQGDDKDDKGVRGKALVKQALTDFAAFSVTSKALRGSVEKYNEGILANSLKRVEKAEGRSLHYLCKKLVADAKLAIDPFLDEKTELSKLESLLENYTKLDAELNERSSKFPQEKERVKNLTGLTARSEFVLRDMKETARSVRAKKPDLAAKYRHNLLESYNNMIKESNDLEFK